MIKNKKRLTFGFIIDWINTGFHIGILSGINDFVKEKDINLLSFVTGRLQSKEDRESGKNTLFDFIDKSNVDGLIFLSSPLQSFIDKNEFIENIKKYHSIPIVSIGEVIPSYPSLIIDNEKGMIGLLTHLVDVHSYKKIAIITGNKENYESRIRLNVYKKFLRSRKIPYNPELVIEGNFSGVSGRNAIKILLNKDHKIDFDVIVASNDLMALGAIEELAFLGLQVPGDVFVVGFDDMEESKNISLTTIRQPLYEYGYLGASIIFKLLNNEKYDLISTLSAELVVRKSCGCYSPNIL